MNDHDRLNPGSHPGPETARRVTLQARGDANIRASHRNTFELTYDPSITPAGTCIVGVATQGDLAGLLALRGAVSITLRCGTLSERVTARINPWYITGDPLIVRTHAEPQHRSLCIAADRGAARFAPAFVAALQDPAAVIEIELAELAGTARGPGVLFVVGLPLGNRRDLSPRAEATLRSADLILAEDPAVVKALLGPDGPRLQTLNAHTVDQRTQDLLAELAAGNRVALVGAAGMPFAFEAGQQIVRAAAADQQLVVAVPGPDFVSAALTAAGFAGEPYQYLGQFPRPAAERGAWLRRLADATCTSVFQEPAARLCDVLAAVAASVPARHVVLCRNLTRPGETILRGTAAQLMQELAGQDAIRGDFLLVVEGGIRTQTAALSGDLRSIAESLVAAGVPTKAIAAALVEPSGIPRRELFAAVVAMKDALG